MKKILSNVLVDNTTDCWLWQKGTYNTGYACIAIDRKSFLVHRLILEIKNGTKPNSSDHLCFRRCCVNPEHLEDTTAKINIQRAAIKNGRKKFCKRGHEMTPENSKTHTNKKGYFTINCRECDKIRKRKAYFLR